MSQQRDQLRRPARSLVADRYQQPVSINSPESRPSNERCKATCGAYVRGSLDVRTLARVAALQSGDMAVMQRDLEMILTIVEMVLPPRLTYRMQGK
jgi:hypothetical protein